MHYRNYLKEQTIFSQALLKYLSILVAHKFYRQWSELLHPFVAFWSSIELWDNTNFNTTDAVLIKMNQILQFWIFWIWVCFFFVCFFFLVVYETSSIWFQSDHFHPVTFLNIQIYRQEWSFWAWMRFKSFSPFLKNKHCYTRAPYFREKTSWLTWRYAILFPN